MTSTCHRSRLRAAFTLVEMIVVLAILVAVAGMVIPLVGNTLDTSQRQATQASMSVLQNTIKGNRSLPGYWGDLRQLPWTMADLFVVPTDVSSGHLPATLQTYDRNTGRGWRGPYIENTSGTYVVDTTNGFTNFTGTIGSGYGMAGDQAVMDAWNRPIVIQFPTKDSLGNTLTSDQQKLYARLVSAGTNHKLETQPSDISATGDDIILYLRATLP